MSNFDIRRPCEVTQSHFRPIEAASDLLKATSDHVKPRGVISDQLKPTSDQLKDTADQLQATADQLKATAEQLKATSDQLKATAAQLQATADQLQATAHKLPIEIIDNQCSLRKAYPWPPPGRARWPTCNEAFEDRRIIENNGKSMKLHEMNRQSTEIKENEWNAGCAGESGHKVRRSGSVWRPPGVSV